MAKHKGQAHAKGHSDGGFGHGGHHSGYSGMDLSKHSDGSHDHIQNPHNKSHAGGHGMHEHGGEFHQGLTEGM
jgi:hypothetical protein